MSGKTKRSFGGPKHPVALGILVVVAVGLIIGNVALVNASNAYVPWSEVDATVVGGPITPEAFLTTATVYLDDENGTAYYEDVFERSDTMLDVHGRIRRHVRGLLDRILDRVRMLRGS